MKLMIIRHATPDYKNKTIMPVGHEESKALAIKLKEIGIDRIFVSPMGRAQHTMQYTSDATGVTPKTQDWMQELVDWQLPNHPIKWPWNIHSDEVFEGSQFYDYANWFRSPIYQEADIESKYDELRHQANIFLEELGYQREGSGYVCVAPKDEHITIFCHAGFGSVLVSYLLNIPFPMITTGFPMKPTSVTYISFKGEKGDFIHPTCLRFGDTSHLDCTELSYL